MSTLPINSASPAATLPPVASSAPPTGSTGSGVPNAGYDLFNDEDASTFALAAKAAAAIESIQRGFVTPNQVSLSNYVDFFQKVTEALLPLKDAISGGDDNKVKVDFSQVRQNLEKILAELNPVMASGFKTREEAEKFLREAGVNEGTGDFPIDLTFDAVPKNGNEYGFDTRVFKVSTQAEAEKALRDAGLDPADFTFAQRYTIWLPTSMVQSIVDSMPVEYNKALDFDHMTRNQRELFAAELLEDKFFGGEVVAGAVVGEDRIPDAYLPLYIKEWRAKIRSGVDNKAAFDYIVNLVSQNSSWAQRLTAKWGVNTTIKASPMQWDNAKYNAWLAGKDSVIQNLQHYSQILSERLGHVNDLYNTINRVLSSTVQDSVEADRAYFNGL